MDISQREGKLSFVGEENRPREQFFHGTSHLSFKNLRGLRSSIAHTTYLPESLVFDGTKKNCYWKS